jgi:hypothetical protein
MFKFTISIKDPAQAFEKAKAAINQAKGKISGNSAAGSFSGSGVEGSYAYEDGNYSITISKKPFLATESMIKKEVIKFFA